MLSAERCWLLQGLDCRTPNPVGKQTPGCQSFQGDELPPEPPLAARIRRAPAEDRRPLPSAPDRAARSAENTSPGSGHSLRLPAARLGHERRGEGVNWHPLSSREGQDVVAALLHPVQLPAALSGLHRARSGHGGTDSSCQTAPGSAEALPHLPALCRSGSSAVRIPQTTRVAHGLAGSQTCCPPRIRLLELLLAECITRLCMPPCICTVTCPGPALPTWASPGAMPGPAQLSFTLSSVTH